MEEIRDLNWLNSLSPQQATEELRQCCGCKEWANEVVSRRPYSSVETLLTTADEVWWLLQPVDWLEAFQSHPKIGEKKATAPVSEQSREWSGQEQAGVSSASRNTIESLAALNQAYEERFGFIFIICAAGKSSEEMLSALRARIENDLPTELPIAAAEQGKITHLRLKKLLSQS
jgi:OHCU decarboxylase